MTMMRVARCPKAEYNVRYWLMVLEPVAVETAAVALVMRSDYDLLSLFRPSLSSIAWPNTHSGLISFHMIRSA